MKATETPKIFRMIVGGLLCVFLLSPTVGEFVTDRLLVVGVTENPCSDPRLGVIPKSPGDNGYKIHISNSPKYYRPGEVYQITLQGSSTQFYLRKFIGFMLRVAAKEEENYISPRPDVGSFHLAGVPLSQYSDDCPNAVVESSSIPKSEIQVSWRAPPPGVGCVVFRATIRENAERWYSNEGNLVLELCEEDKISDEDKPKTEGCCACGRATYELSFQGLWSRETHPQDFPTNPWLNHFSDIIGASHSLDYRMWQNGGYASEGVKDVAEKGATRKLEADLKTKTRQVFSIFKASGLWHPNLHGVTSTEFTVTDQHRLVSFVTMLSPSADWIVGIDSLDLCLGNCSWVTEVVEDLYLWDAGTSEGVTYQVRRQPTIPQEKIRRITSSEPNDPLSPFYDPSGAPMKPFARLTLRRQQVFEEPCGEKGPSTPNSGLNAVDNEATAECPVSDWTEFSPCSATCGDGFRMRSRQYLNPAKASMIGCSVALVDKQPCEVLCVGNVSCQTSDWEEWSECSVTCGKGIRTRSRKFLEYRARKVCPVEISQKEMCMGMKPECENPENVNPLCSVTAWSSWSPCTVTCGQGVKIRTRLYLDPASGSICNEQLMEKTVCRGIKESCELDPAEAKKICMMPKEIGRCRGYFPRWHFDVNRLTCVQFIYGGCRGNMNNFEFERDCLMTCEALFKASDDTTTSTVATRDVEHQENSPVDCMITPWSEWTPCSQTCGTGRKERRRMIKAQPENGGQSCPEKLVQRKRCSDTPECATSLYTGVVHEYVALPCDISPPSARDSVALVIWYKDEYPAPIYIVDARVDTIRHYASQSSHFGNRTFFNMTNTPAFLQLDPVQEDDAGKYRCRVDFRKSRTVNTVLTLKVIAAATENPFHLAPHDTDHRESTAVDCMVTPWSEWSQCSHTCGSGQKTRNRMIKIHPENGGKPCPEKLVQRRRCGDIPPCPEIGAENETDVDCELSPWSEWAPCSKTCGDYGFMERIRTIIQHPRNNGTPCGHRFDKRYCRLAPCPV